MPLGGFGRDFGSAVVIRREVEQQTIKPETIEDFRQKVIDSVVNSIDPKIDNIAEDILNLKNEIKNTQQEAVEDLSLQIKERDRLLKFLMGFSWFSLCSLSFVLGYFSSFYL